MKNYPKREKPKNQKDTIQNNNEAFDTIESPKKITFKIKTYFEIPKRVEEKSIEKDSSDS